MGILLSSDGEGDPNPSLDATPPPVRITTMVSCNLSFNISKLLLKIVCYTLYILIYFTVERIYKIMFLCS